MVRIHVLVLILLAIVGTGLMAYRKEGLSKEQRQKNREYGRTHGDKKWGQSKKGKKYLAKKNRAQWAGRHYGDAKWGKEQGYGGKNYKLYHTPIPAATPAATPATAPAPTPAATPAPTPAATPAPAPVSDTSFTCYDKKGKKTECSPSCTFATVQQVQWAKRLNNFEGTLGYTDKICPPAPAPPPAAPAPAPAPTPAPTPAEQQVSGLPAGFVTE